jgi:hypothetical protein
MKPINTVPIEDFLNKTRIASKSNQKQVVLDIKEAVAIADSLALVMTRMSGELEQIMAAIGSAQPASNAPTQIKMDGGLF